MRKLAALAFLLLLAPAAAQDVEPVVSAQVDSFTDLLTSQMNALPRSGGPLAACQSDGSLRIIDARTFQFAEEGNQAGCAQAAFDIQIPNGARTLTATFLADRIITPTLDDAAAPQFVQRVQLLDRDNVLLDEASYYSQTGPEEREALPQAILLRIPEGLDIGRVAWYFEDASASLNLGLVATTPASRSTIRNPDIDFASTPVPFTTTFLDTRRDAGETVQPISVALQVAPTALHANNRMLTLQVLDAYDQLQTVRTPGGRTLHASDVVESSQGGITQFSIPHALVEGPGEYVFELHGAVQVAPTRIHTAVWIFFALPILLGTVATVNQHRYRNELTPEQHQNWRRLLVALVAIWLLYVLYMILVPVQGVFQSMAHLPLDGEGTLFWAMLSGIIAAFIVHLGFSAIRRSTARELQHTAQLEATNADLLRSNKELEQFAYVASHDLQEPLRKIVGYTNLLEHRYSSQLDAKGKKYVEQATHQATRMRRVIQDVLAFSRLGTNAPMATVDLVSVVDEIRNDLPEELANLGATISFEGAAAAHGNRPMVRQLLENLVGNGIKYRRPGVAPAIVISAKRRATSTLVSVQDNGIGIAPEYHARVFALFERLHGHDSAYEGTGIGLSICKKIVEVHGGTIGLESTQGEGSRFFFTLPHGGT